ncbi:MAG: hypothetical protein RG741_02860 [Bacteroidales bacterium]|nr:hypothetical protein [Bacteroidales bacterium]
MQKKLPVLLIIVLIIPLWAFAQNPQPRMDDRDRIAIMPLIDEQVEISGQARNLLQARMSNIINLNGLAAREEASYFVMVPQISVVSEDITPTAPPMHAVTLYISFSIIDNYTGTVFGETGMEVRGVDQSRERAFTHAIRGINPRSGQYRVFMERAKDRILSFYNTQCDLVIAAAQSLVEQDRKREAIEILTSVPPVSRECYDLCMALAGEIGPVPVPEPEMARESQPEADTEQETRVKGMKGRLRNLEVEILQVEFTGNNIDVSLLLTNNTENTSIMLRSARFIDRRGNEFDRRLYISADLVRGVPTRRDFSFSDPNIDLVDFMRMLELNFSREGTLMFENIEVKR